MQEIIALLAAAEKLAGETPDESVLVTLVKTEGSTYRRPGARMLVLPGCRTIGTISGGCLEAMVARQAWEATRGGQRVVLQVESAPEDDAWGPASGCHGRLFLLAEPIPPGQRHPVLEVLAKSRRGDEPAVIVHEFRIAADGTPLPTTMRVEAANGDLPAKSVWVEQAGGGVAAFREFLPPLPHLLICGAGDDARPVARIAAELGWRIGVIDSRARLATAERFGDAENVSAAGPAGIAPLVHRHTAAVVMSHRFADDVEYLGHLVACDLPYIGLLGPRTRAGRLLAELAERGAAPLSPQQLANLFNPVGLDIGAREPELIALAIIAEIQGVLAGRDGRSLTHQVGPIQVPGAASPA